MHCWSIFGAMPGRDSEAIKEQVLDIELNGWCRNPIVTLSETLGSARGKLGKIRIDCEMTCCTGSTKCGRNFIFISQEQARSWD